MNTLAPQSSFAFSSRDLLIGVALAAVLLSVYSTFGFFHAAPCALVVPVALMYWGHRTGRRPYVWAACILMLPAVCLTAVALFAILAFGFGPVYAREKWPDHVYYFARTGESGTSNVKVACLGDFFDSEYVWRQPFPHNKLQELVVKGDLESIAPAAVSPNFFSMFPYRWRPDFGPNCEFYATTAFDPDGRGADGKHFYVMHDRDQGLLYVWYKDNF